MKITIHQTIRRPWGYETPYTAVDMENIYNGYIDAKSATVQDVEAEVAKKKLQKKAPADESEEALVLRKVELKREISEIDDKIALITGR